MFHILKIGMKAKSQKSKRVRSTINFAFIWCNQGIAYHYKYNNYTFMRHSLFFPNMKKFLMFPEEEIIYSLWALFRTWVVFDHSLEGLDGKKKAPSGASRASAVTDRGHSVDQWHTIFWMSLAQREAPKTGCRLRPAHKVRVGTQAWQMAARRVSGQTGTFLLLFLPCHHPEPQKHSLAIAQLSKDTSTGSKRKISTVTPIALYPQKV